MDRCDGYRISFNINYLLGYWWYHRSPPSVITVPMSPNATTSFTDTWILRPSSRISAFSPYLPGVGNIPGAGNKAGCTLVSSSMINMTFFTCITNTSISQCRSLPIKSNKTELVRLSQRKCFDTHHFHRAKCIHYKNVIDMNNHLNHHLNHHEILWICNFRGCQ